MGFLKLPLCTATLTAHSNVREPCVPGHETKAPFPLGPDVQPDPGKSSLGPTESIQQVSVGFLRD